MGAAVAGNTLPLLVAAAICCGAGQSEGELLRTLGAEHAAVERELGEAPRRLGVVVDVLLDEVHTAREGLSGQIDVDKSNGVDDTDTITKKIERMVMSWSMYPSDIPLRHRIADAAIGARSGSRQGSIAAELSAAGLAWTASSKGRRSDGWQIMSKLFRQAGQGAPGLFVSERCLYWWATVPVLPVHRTDMADLEGPDHAGDACRYLCVALYGHGAGTATRGHQIY